MKKGNLLKMGAPAIREGSQHSEAKTWGVSEKGAHVTHATMVRRDGLCIGAMEKRIDLGTPLRLRALRR